ncbi:MAG TPA: hypothetical protein VLA72_19040 [Anaerolineales bacterium]|nr:hypothetical protein [Anaerolineales bacterium]
MGTSEVTYVNIGTGSGASKSGWTHGFGAGFCSGFRLSMGMRRKK